MLMPLILWSPCSNAPCWKYGFYFPIFLKTLRLLRGDNYVADEEIDEIQTIVEEEQKTSTKISKSSLLKCRTFLLPALLITVSFTFQVVSGIEICTYYVGFIFKDVGVRLEIAAIIIQVIQYLHSAYLLCLYIYIIYKTYIYILYTYIYITYIYIIYTNIHIYFVSVDHYSWIYFVPTTSVQIWL